MQKNEWNYTLKSVTCEKGEILESFMVRLRATYKWWQNWMLPREGEREGSEESVGPANHDSFILIHNLGRGGESGSTESDGMGS